MKDFICIDIESDLSGDEIRHYVGQLLAEFRWRSGDSDSQGAYVSGMSDEGIQIKLWFDENPIAMSVSFRNVWLESLERESNKQKLIDRVKETFLPVIGKVVKFDM